MEEMLNKLELMLMGLRQMKTNVVFAWFPKMDKEEILKAIDESPKFKIEGDIVKLKSETEIYEEELQKDILKDLMGDEDEDSLDVYESELELIEITADDETEDTNGEKNLEEEIKIDSILNGDDSIEEETDEMWADLQKLANDVVADNSEEESQEIEEVAAGITEIEEIEEIEEFEEIEKIEEVKEESEDSMKEKVVEKIVEKTVVVKDLSDIKGSELEYKDLVRLINEYNDSVENKLGLADENSFEVKERAVVTFYEKKYLVKIKENNILDMEANVYSLINKKRGMEVGYLIVCDLLNEEILNYALDNYDDEVVYFCPLNGTNVDFEVGLNEFFLKDTGIIFDKYLERYVITDEKKIKIKKLEIVVGR